MLTALPIAEVYNFPIAFRITGSTKVYAKISRDYAQPKLVRCAPIRIYIDGMSRKAQSLNPAQDTEANRLDWDCWGFCVRMASIQVQDC